MAELNATQIQAKITAIDADIATVTDELGSGGPVGAANLPYEIGNKKVDGSFRLKQLIETRKLYQDLLNQIPSVIIRDHGMEVEPGTGKDRTEFIGDQT